MLCDAKTRNPRNEVPKIRKMINVLGSLPCPTRTLEERIDMER
jgi:hypothetical protein